MAALHTNSSNLFVSIAAMLAFIWFVLGFLQANGLANTRTISTTNTCARTKLTATSSHQGGSLPSLPNIKAAVIVPGFLTGKDEFLPLAKSLTSKGIPTVVVPMPNWHWLPCLGGRSMRPMLERIDFTVRHLAAVAGNLSDFDKATLDSLDENKFTQKDGLIVPKEDAIIQTDNPQLLIPDYDYNIFDLYQDFRNNPGGVLKVGGSVHVEDYPLWDPKGTFMKAPEPMGKVALIGHSAGGWICRAYLSQRSYGGKAYCGNELVHSLITLGSPHGNAPGPAFKGVEWVNRERLDDVRVLGVGGTGYKGT
jgi:triacylglycerol esterase/lipase EstA (alpha/beta hydrolase family)